MNQYPAALADLGRIRTAVQALEESVERTWADAPRDATLRLELSCLVDARERIGDLERSLMQAQGLAALGSGATSTGGA